MSKKILDPAAVEPVAYPAPFGTVAKAARLHVGGYTGKITRLGFSTKDGDTIILHPLGCWIQTKEGDTFIAPVANLTSINL